MLINHEKDSSVGIAGRIAGFFLRNRQLSVLSIVVLAVWGVFSFMLMPKQYNPEIVAPAFVITTDFSGATAEEVYEFVTRPMEDKLSELSNIDEIASESIPGGRSIVTVKFSIGSDREAAKTVLNQKLRDNMDEKPDAAHEPLVQSIDPDDVPILDIGLSSLTLSESSLRKLAFDIADDLKLAEGISKIEVKGGRTNHLQVELDGALLAARGISTNEIIAAVSAANDVFTVDFLKGDERNQRVNVVGNIADASVLGDTIVRHEGSHVVRLRDIAAVSYGPGEITHFVRRTGVEGSVPMVHITLAKLSGTNSTDVSNRVRDRLEQLEDRLIPPDTEVSILNDEGEIANDEISKLTFDLVKSIMIVGVLLYVFLGLKNSLITAISIPLTLLSVFGIGLLFDQTVNRITLFALILSLGLLVDDAIVVIENIARYFRLYPKENRMTLIIRAVDEVGGALALSTFTMAIAFLPMAFVTGMMGPYMSPIPFFVPVALLASLLLSVTLNPFLAFVFAKKPSEHEEESVGEHDYESGFFSRLVKRTEERYAILLTALIEKSKLRRRFLWGILALLVFSLVLPMTPLVPFRMLPKADKDQFFVYLDLPDGTALSRTDAVALTLEKEMLSEEGIKSIESFVGQSSVIDFNGLFKGSESRTMENQATLKARLVHYTEREKTSEEIATSLRHRLQSFFADYPDATIRLIEDPPGPPVLATFLMKVKGSNDAVREMIASDFEREIRAVSGIVDVDTSLPERGFELKYRVDSEKAGLLGIASTEIVSALHTALSGTRVGLYHDSSRDGLRKPEQEQIVIRFSPESRNEEQDLSLIMLTGKNGVRVPLSEVLVRTNSAVDMPIASDERERVSYLSGEMENRSVIYAVIDLFPTLLDYRLPSGTGELVSWSLLGAEYKDTVTHERYRIEFGGEWELTLEVFRDLGIAMALALFLIYFVLSAKTGSLFVPLLIMVSIPLSLIGVLPGFAILQEIKGTYFNATSMIGVVALAGLSVKNVVIYLEYLEPLKKAGRPLKEALVETGRIRLLPIALTSLAAILGSFTIVSDPVWEGLAWAIILGLTASTVLTLLVFPLVYYATHRRSWYKEEKHPAHK